ASIVVEDNWSGRIWAQSAECKAKRCNSPYTVAVLKFEEKTVMTGIMFQLQTALTDQLRQCQVWLPKEIQPTSPNHSCKTAVCQANINHHCPPTHQIKNIEGVVVACKSAPELFQKLCPLAIASEADDISNMLSCRSNTYLVLIG
ncbi:hypothetical protein NQ314_016628, partial [Rhamnusium bicolor]